MYRTVYFLNLLFRCTGTINYREKLTLHSNFSNVLLKRINLHNGIDKVQSNLKLMDLNLKLNLNLTFFFTAGQIKSFHLMFFSQMATLDLMVFFSQLAALYLCFVLLSSIARYLHVLLEAKM